MLSTYMCEMEYCNYCVQTRFNVLVILYKTICALPHGLGGGLKTSYIHCNDNYTPMARVD